MARVLIVDDSAFSRKQLCRILRPAGYDIVEADNGETGLTAVEEHHPDCVVTDLLMPKIDGVQFLRGLHARGISIPVLVHTADIQETTRKECLDHHCFGFVNKPCRPEDLLKWVEQMIHEKSNPV